MTEFDGAMAGSGVIALQGGGPFVANDPLDAALLADVDRVVVLPTADAYERPADLVASAERWGDRVGVAVVAAMVLTRSQADERAAAVIAEAGAVILAGDSAIHLRSTLKDTPVLAAVVDVLARGGVVIANGPCAAAVCDPMTDLRGGGFGFGLGLVRQLAVIPGCETWPGHQLARAHSLATTTVVDLPTGAALVRRVDGWETYGDAVVHGPLP